MKNTEPGMEKEIIVECMVCRAKMEVGYWAKCGFLCDECRQPPEEKHEAAIPDVNFIKLCSLGIVRPERGLRGLYCVGLDRLDGSAWMVDHRTVEGMMYGVRISYEELKSACIQNGCKLDVEKLSCDNWVEYTLFQDGEWISFQSRYGGTGQLASKYSYYMEVRTDDYFVKWECGSPMAGMYGDRWSLPIGFFAEKTAEQIVQYFEDNKGYIDEVSITDKDLDMLIRTDRYRLAKKQSAGKTEEI